MLNLLNNVKGDDNGGWDSGYQRFIEGTSKDKGMEPFELLMDLAMFTGLEKFNPRRASERELMELAEAIPLYLEKSLK